jgi:hypothetical protein
MNRYDQEVGYTQGLAFIVAALLLNVSSKNLRLANELMTRCLTKKRSVSLSDLWIRITSDRIT